MIGKNPPTEPAIGTQQLFKMRFPAARQEIDQDEEWCEVRLDEQWRRFRFHDYADIYDVPGLYESLFYRTLKCCSPTRVAGLLDEMLSDARQPAERLNVLEVGAGNGMAGEALRNLGVRGAIGVDIIEEARRAVMRDRPWVYDDYLVQDLCDLSEPTEKKLRDARFNCLVTVAALGFGDIPPKAFITALNVIDTPSWMAFNIKENFLCERDNSGFSRLIRELNRDEIIQVQAYRRYRHRLSVTGEPLYYVAMVAIKQRELPDRYLESDWA